MPPTLREAVSGWVEITQSMIDCFGRNTLDPDPMHIDPEWAAANSPFGGTIAFGFLTIALLSHLMHDAQGRATALSPDPARHGYFLNYGFDRLRLVQVVPVGSHVRGHFSHRETRIDEKGRHVATFDCTIEIRGQTRPALVAQWLAIWIPASA